MTKEILSKEIIIECRKKLVSLRMDLINRVRAAKMEFDSVDKSGGDEADQTTALLAENTFLLSQDRLRSQLLEVERALARIENGGFGICEETDEPIEIERLLAVPWTRLSLEGAELREAMNKKYAR